MRIEKGDTLSKIAGQRYATIHVLFRELALEKNLIKNPISREKNLKNISRNAIKIKQFWKDFFGINSLTDLSDFELHNLEHFIEKRIKAVNKKHD